jgi:hypothetical protein
MTASLPSIPKPGPFDQLLSLGGKCAVVTGAVVAWAKQPFIG